MKTLEELRKVKSFCIAARSKLTGDFNVCYDTDKPGDEHSPAGGRYAVVCEGHETQDNTDDQDLAYKLLHHPVKWCEKCKDEQKRLDEKRSTSAPRSLSN
jgi:hypothetical protein